MSASISEQAVLFGHQNGLVGIFARPPASACQDNPTIVVLNTGVIHRVGHHRMYVTMARALASAGYPVLRFDLSGIGDSDLREGALSPLDAAVADIREALDWLEATSAARRVVLVGLCSGADQAVAYAHTDERIVGIVLLDPSIPATWRHYLHYVTPRMTRVESWTHLLTFRSRKLRLWAHRKLDRLRRSGSEAPQTSRTDQLERGKIGAYYQGAVDQGIRMLAVFTGDPERQTYREQLLEALPDVQFGDRLQLEYLARSDHTFILESDRVWLTALILRWLAAGDGIPEWAQDQTQLPKQMGLSQAQGL